MNGCEDVRRLAKQVVVRFCVGALRSKPDVSGRDLLRLLAEDLHDQGTLDQGTLEALRSVGIDPCNTDC